MTNESHKTIRLQAAARRKLEHLASRDGISLDDALNRLIRAAPCERKPRPRYRVRPRKVGFGFETARARQIAAEMADERTLRKLLATFRGVSGALT